MWLLFLTGSSPFPALRWLTLATSCATNQLRALAEPHFSDGYLHAGGKLPQNWRQLARLVDVSALCESLTHGQLPDTVVAELVELIRAVVENRDPRLA